MGPVGGSALAEGHRSLDRVIKNGFEVKCDSQKPPRQGTKRLSSPAARGRTGGGSAQDLTRRVAEIQRGYCLNPCWLAPQGQGPEREGAAPSCVTGTSASPTSRTWKPQIPLNCLSLQKLPLLLLKGEDSPPPCLKMLKKPPRDKTCSRQGLHPPPQCQPRPRARSQHDHAQEGPGLLEGERTRARRCCRTSPRFGTRSEIAGPATAEAAGQGRGCCCGSAAP